MRSVEWRARVWACLVIISVMCSGAMVVGAADVAVLVNDVRFVGVTVFSGEALQAELGDVIGTEKTFSELETLAALVTRYYRERGYPVARAYLPAQTIENGVVQIGVLEGRYGHIRIENSSRLRDHVLERLLSRIVPGDLIEQKTLDRALLLLHDLPGIAVRSTLEPGSEAGESHLVVSVTNTPGYDFHIGLDNGGNELTGTWRGLFRGGWNNLFGLGDHLSLNGQLTSGGGLGSVRIGYALPVGSQPFTLSASLSTVQYELGGPFKILGASGGSFSGDVSLSYPLQRSSGRTLELITAVNIQRNDRSIVNDATEKQMTSLNVSVRDRHTLRQGSLRHSIQLTFGTLDIVSAIAKAEDAASAETQGSFTKVEADFNYAHRVNPRTQWSVSARGQIAGKNLDDSAKISLGGISAVRAYPPGEASGDTGMVATFDVSHAPRFFDSLPGSWRLNAFLDAGAIKTNAIPWTGADEGGRVLTGVGIGLAFAHGARYTANVEYACKIGDEPATSAENQNCRVWARFGAAF